MRTLTSHDDSEPALAFICRLYACHNADELRRTAVRGIAELIGGDRVSFQNLAPTVSSLWMVSEPDEPCPPEFWEKLLTHLHEHPAMNHYQQTGDLSAAKISDFLTQRQWHRTGLYQRLYRGWGIEDQMVSFLGPPTREFCVLVLNRGRRNFSERDRMLLNLLRPHVAQAHTKARGTERLHALARKQAELNHSLDQSAILLNARGEVVHCPARARIWLREFFAHEFRDCQLPPALAAWLRQNLPDPAAAPRQALAPVAPFVLNQQGNRLVCRLCDAPKLPRLAILLELHPVPRTAARRAFGLTPRQVEVLREVEAGKSNEEIGAALFISPLTVRTHLDNVFNLLGVRSRTAAVARLRQII